MGMKPFHIITTIWCILFFAAMIFCAVNAIVSLKKGKNRFLWSYVPEVFTVIINAVFMYLIDKDYIDYGDHKFSGLDAMGDWLGFAILIGFTAIPFVITLICNIVSAKRKKRQQSLPEKEDKL